MSKSKRSATVDTALIEAKIGTGYPALFSKKCQQREKKVLGDLFGLDQFGVNLTTLPPGQWSALRHWHQNEDEFIYVLNGDLVLIDDQGEHQLTAGMCAGFAAGKKNGHHIVNNSDQPGSFIEIGTRSKTEHAEYPDDDLIADKDVSGFVFSHRNGESY